MTGTPRGTAGPPRAAARLVLLTLGTMLAAPPLPALTQPHGVTVEKVENRSAMAAAGLQPGDVLLSWSLLFPSAPFSSWNAIASPYDWDSVVLEQLPRGVVALAGRRGGGDAVWILPADAWGEVRVRPPLPDLLALFTAQARRLEGEDAAGSRAALELAAGLARTGGTPGETTAWLLSRLGGAAAAAGRPDEADAAFLEASALLERYGSQSARAHRWRSWAYTLFERGDLLAAADAYARALALDLAQAPRGSLAEAASRTGLGNAASQHGDSREAARHFTEALALREQIAAGSAEMARSLIDLGIEVALQGDLTTAEAHFHRALAIQQRARPMSLELAQTLNNLGVVAGRRGYLAAEEEYYRRALDLKLELGQTGPEIASTLNNLGIVARQRGDLETAESYLRRALDLHEQEGNLLHQATAWNNLGILSLKRHDLDTAEERFRRALALREAQSAASPKRIEALANLAIVMTERGRFDEAVAFERQALALAENLQPDGLLVAARLNRLGVTELERGDFAAAERFLLRSLALHRAQAPESLLVSDDLQPLGALARRQGELAVARQRLEEALALVHRHAPGSLDEAEALYELGLTLEQSGQGERGRELFCGAVEVLDGPRRRLGGGELERAHFGEVVIEVYTACAEALYRVGRAEEAFRTLERGRARLYLSLLAERDLRFVEGPEALESTEPLGLAQARTVLEPGTVLLSWTVDRERTLLYAVSTGPRAGAVLLSIPLGREALRRKVQAFRRLVEDPGARRGDLEAQGRELYDLLLGPAEKLIAGGRRLLLSPDGPLNSLPFAALVRRGEPLVVSHPLHTTLSATVYAELRKRRRPPRAGAPIVLFGDPRYTPPALTSAAAAPAADAAVLRAVARGLSLEPLPQSRGEVLAIAAHFRGENVRTFLGAEATEENAKASSGARILHFATHGLWDERRPLHSALALASPEASSPGGDNGLLEAWEVFESVRLEADLVTLSACDTGLGQEASGEGMIGLTRAFQFAGARSVVSSLWSISDDSTAELMSRFYGYLRRGLPKDVALARAQAHLSRRPATAAPYHWAAFQLAGDFR